MLTEQELILKFKQHPELQKRVGILKIASEINPDFKNPHIIGGYLRDLVLGREKFQTLRLIWTVAEP